jgi:hypothetical protein
LRKTCTLKKDLEIDIHREGNLVAVPGTSRFGLETIILLPFPSKKVFPSKMTARFGSHRIQTIPAP